MTNIVYRQGIKTLGRGARGKNKGLGGWWAGGGGEIIGIKSHSNISENGTVFLHFKNKNTHWVTVSCLFGFFYLLRWIAPYKGFILFPMVFFSFLFLNKKMNTPIVFRFGGGGESWTFFEKILWILSFLQ